MATPRLLTPAVQLRSAFGRRPKFTSVAERLVVLAALIYADVALTPWWARLAISLVASVATFNVIGVALLAHRRSPVTTGPDQTSP